MKILALDLGDRWVGTAIADPLGITCRPYQTVATNLLQEFLTRTIPLESISTIVVGYPKTFSGGQSEQTLRIIKQKEELEQHLNSTLENRPITWILWDERLSSKRAEELHRGARTPEEKKKSHSIAAAFILQNYLDHVAFAKGEPEE